MEMRLLRTLIFFLRSFFVSQDLLAHPFLPRPKRTGLGSFFLLTQCSPFGRFGTENLDGGHLIIPGLAAQHLVVDEALDGLLSANLPRLTPVVGMLVQHNTFPCR